MNTASFLVLFSITSISSVLSYCYSPDVFIIHHRKDFRLYSEHESRNFDRPIIKESGTSVPSKQFEKLKAVGQSGILAYGLLNFAWYTVATTVFWNSSKNIFVNTMVKASVWDRLLSGAFRLFKVMALVWAGSQVTKPLRIAGALFLAPFADLGLTKFGEKFNLSRPTAFWRLSAILLGSCLLFFISLVTSSAIISQPLQTTGLPNLLSFSLPILPIFYQKKYFCNNENQLFSSSSSSSSSSSFALSSTPPSASSELKSNKKQVPRKYNVNRYNEPIDPQNKRHGWDSHPRICRGFWKIDKILPNDFLLSKLGGIETTMMSNMKKLDDSNTTLSYQGNMDSLLVENVSNSSTSISIGTECLSIQSEHENVINSSIVNMKDISWVESKRSLLNKMISIDHIILKEEGQLKCKNEFTQTYGWEFTPANKRILFEIIIPSENSTVLRFSSEMTRVPYVVTRAIGTIRCRQMVADEDPGDFKCLPPSNRNWPVIGEFQMSKLLYGKYGKSRHLADTVKKGLLLVNPDDDSVDNYDDDDDNNISVRTEE